MFEVLGDAALIDSIVAEAGSSAAADARKYAAIAELERRRNTGEHDLACDDWDAAAGEVAAALNIGHGPCRNAAPTHSARLPPDLLDFRVNVGVPTVPQSSTTAAPAASSSTSSPIGNRRRPHPMPNSRATPSRVRRRGDERRPH
jgi:hypothetical protein